VSTAVRRVPRVLDFVLTRYYRTSFIGQIVLVIISLGYILYAAPWILWL